MSDNWVTSMPALARRGRIGDRDAHRLRGSCQHPAPKLCCQHAIKWLGPEAVEKFWGNRKNQTNNDLTSMHRSPRCLPCERAALHPRTARERRPLKGAKIWSVMRCACKCDAIRQVQALRRSCRRSPETENEALPNRRAHVDRAHPPGGTDARSICRASAGGLKVDLGQ
jgi:hypothetical protein